MKKILFLIFFLIFPLSPQLLSADVVTISRTDDFTQFESYISHIVLLDKYIEKLPDVPMKYKLQSQMDVYIEEAKKISNSLSFPMRAKGTLDISDTFHFSIQKYKLSCEIAAFRMALESLGKTDITEDSIISSLKIFSQPLSTDGIW